MKTLKYSLWRRTPLDICILFVGLGLVVSIWATPLPQISIPKAAWVLLGIGLYYITAWWSAIGENHLVWAGRGLALIGLGLGIYGLFTVKWDPYTTLTFLPFDFLDRLPRLPEQQVHPNVMAGALALLIPLIVGLALSKKSVPNRANDPGRLVHLERLVYGLIGLGLMIVVILTKSRGGYLGVVVGLGLVLVYKWQWKAVLGLAALGVLMGLSFAPGIQERVWGSFDPQAKLQDAVDQNLAGRLDIWSRAVYMLEDFPWSGIGMGTFTSTADTFYPFGINPPGTVTHAHNLFLQIGLDLGLVGISGWLGALLCAIGAARSGLSWPNQRRLAIGLLGSFTALTVHGLVDATTWGTRPALLVWVLWGLAAGLWRARNKHV